MAHNGNDIELLQNRIWNLEEAQQIRAWVLIETDARVHWLLTNYGLWSEEGTFTFPDGFTYYR